MRSDTGDHESKAMSIPRTPESPAETPTCYRHPGRETYVRCTRCNRYICPDCMRDAAVGHQCVECVREGARTVRQPSHFGGRQRSNTPVVTYVLIALNVLMFILQSVSVDLLRELTLRPPAIADGDLYRLVTSAFLHYGVMHLLFNMWALYVVTVKATDCNSCVRSCRAMCGLSRRRIRCSGVCWRRGRSSGGAACSCWLLSCRMARQAPSVLMRRTCLAAAWRKARLRCWCWMRRGCENCTG